MAAVRPNFASDQTAIDCRSDFVSGQTATSCRLDYGRHRPKFDSLVLPTEAVAGIARLMPAAEVVHLVHATVSPRLVARGEGRSPSGRDRGPLGCGGGHVPSARGGGHEALSPAAKAESAPRGLASRWRAHASRRPRASQRQLTMEVACLAVGLHRNSLSPHCRRDCAPATIGL